MILTKWSSRKWTPYPRIESMVNPDPPTPFRTGPVRVPVPLAHRLTMALSVCRPTPSLRYLPWVQKSTPCFSRVYRITIMPWKSQPRADLWAEGAGKPCYGTSGSRTTQGSILTGTFPGNLLHVVRARRSSQLGAHD